MGMVVKGMTIVRRIRPHQSVAIQGGIRAFKCSSAGEYAPNQITLKAVVVNVKNITYQWKELQGNSWVSISGATADTLLVVPSSAWDSRTLGVEVQGSNMNPTNPILFDYTTITIARDTPQSEQAGGKNYVKNGNFSSGTDFWVKNPVNGEVPEVQTIYSENYVPPGAVSILKVTIDNSGKGLYQPLHSEGISHLELNKPYTLSFLARKKSNSPATDLQVKYEADNPQPISLTNNWKRYIRTFTPTEASSIVIYPTSSGEKTFYITNIKIETGERASDYDDYPFLQEAIQGSTDINGGLALSNVLGVKDKVGKVRAYMSGLKDTLTAFAAGVSNFGTSDEERKIDIRHDGSAKIGVFDIDNKKGAVSVFDKDDPQLKRFSIIPEKIPSIEELVGTTIAQESVNCADFQRVGTVSGVFLSSEIMILEQPYNKVTLKSDNVHIEMPNGSDFNILIGLYKENASGNYELYARNIAIGHAYNTSGNTIFLSDPISGVQHDVPAGRYKMAIEFELNNITVLQLKSLSMSYIANVDVRRIEYGTNGFMAFYNYGGQKNFMHVTEQGGVQIGGQTDMPGILASGSSSKYGSLDRAFGKTDYVQKITGGYRIYHNIGHSDFSVQITPHLLGVGQTNDDGFNIGAVGDVAVDIFGYGGFDFAFIGKNYV